eukprot:COSAG01_NODE_11966_length_1825_cov_1.896871_2_plen_429_part_00
MVDLCADDDTVKIRYLDGGMKRLPRRNFLQLIDDHSMDTGKVFQSMTDIEFDRAFHEMDTDQSGSLSPAELVRALKGVGQACSIKTAKALVQDASDGGTGIQLEQYRALVRQREETCRSLYDLLKDKSEEQLNLSKTGESHISSHITTLLGSEFNVQAFIQVLEGMDTDRDGLISFPEFQRALLFSSVLDSKRGIYGLAQTSLCFTGFTDEHHCIPAWMSLSSGFLSGAISRTCTHPMERASLVMRASTDGAGLATVVQRMVADGGVRTLWRGNGANICQVGPEMAIIFFMYDLLKRNFLDDPSQPTPLEKFSCGALAGAMAGVVAQPMNTVGARLAVAKTGMYSSIPDCLGKTFADGGVRALYRGFSVNLPRIVISRGGEMTIFNSCVAPSASAQCAPYACEQAYLRALALTHPPRCDGEAGTSATD